MLVPARRRPDRYGQQHLQRLAHGRGLARPVTPLGGADRPARNRAGAPDKLSLFACTVLSSALPIGGQTGTTRDRPRWEKTQRTGNRPAAWEANMVRVALRFVGTGLVLLMLGLDPAVAQKSGGILRQYIIDSPASMSIHEDTTVVAQPPMMGVMNNLVMFAQHTPQNSLQAIVPDLATDWAW